MVFPVYTNFVAPAIDAGNLNEVNGVIYNILGSGGTVPLSGLDVRNNTGTTAAIATGNAATLVSANANTTAAILAATGRLIGVQTFSANGTYTPTAGTTSIIIKAWGAGGAGGGAGATGAGQISAGAGGSSGGYFEHRLTSGFSGAAIVIGAAGVGVAGVAGGNGGNTSFATVIAGGGGGSSASSILATGTVRIQIAAPGAAGAVSGSPNLISASGNVGSWPWTDTSASAGAQGAPSNLGGMTTEVNNAVGVASTTIGAGGGGASNAPSQGAKAGGNGGPGFMQIYEYA